MRIFILFIFIISIRDIFCSSIFQCVDKGINDCKDNLNSVTYALKNSCPGKFCTSTNGITFSCSYSRRGSTPSGFFAASAKDCMSGMIDEFGICQGKLFNASCTENGECEAGMLCANKFCKYGARFNNSCDNSNNICQNNLYCNSTKICQFRGSLDLNDLSPDINYYDNSYEDGSLRCKSLYTLNGVCALSPKLTSASLIKSGEFCTYSDGTKAAYGSNRAPVYRKDGLAVCAEYFREENIGELYFKENFCPIGYIYCDRMKLRGLYQFYRAYTILNIKNILSQDYFDCSDDTRYQYNTVFRTSDPYFN